MKVFKVKMKFVSALWAFYGEYGILEFFAIQLSSVNAFSTFWSYTIHGNF